MQMTERQVNKSHRLLKNSYLRFFFSNHHMHVYTLATYMTLLLSVKNPENISNIDNNKKCVISMHDF